MAKPKLLKIKVANMESNRGRTVPNQFIVRTKDGIYFQSYDSVIAFRDNNGNVTLDENYWDYSRTTGIYRNDFLGENTAETRKKVENGTYALADLN